jgi:hypothetical protein
MGLTLDLSVSEEGETVAIAIKHNNDPAAYAYDPEVYSLGNLRNDDLQLPDELYELTVVAQAGEIKSPPRRFLLHNAGTSPRDLRLWSRSRTSRAGGVARWPSMQPSRCFGQIARLDRYRACRAAMIWPI